MKCHYDKYGYHLWQSALESVLNRLNHIDYTIDGFDVQISDSRSWANSWEKLINYKNRFEVSIGEYFKAGNINLSEAQKLIQSIISNQEYDINLLSRRFPFVFIDEYQDQMNNTFLNLLENLKENKVMVQMIGDANQQIYYGQPYYEKESLLFNYYNLNITNRFSNQIAQPLNNMFKGSLEPASFTKSEKPILYIYESPENIINFIDFFPEKDSGILVLEHKHAEDFKLATQNVKENQISRVQKITDKLIGILAERLAKPKSQCKQILMRKYEEDYIELNKFILNGIQNKNEEHDEKDFLRNLNEVLSCEKVSNIRSNNSIIQDFFSSLNKILLDANQKRRTVPVSTIHGVKGLTFNSICVYLQEDSVLQNAFLHSYELDSDKEFNAIYKRILST